MEAGAAGVKTGLGLQDSIVDRIGVTLEMAGEERYRYNVGRSPEVVIGLGLSLSLSLGLGLSLDLTADVSNLRYESEFEV